MSRRGAADRTMKESWRFFLSFQVDCINSCPFHDIIFHFYLAIFGIQKAQTNFQNYVRFFDYELIRSIWIMSSNVENNNRLLVVLHGFCVFLLNRKCASRFASMQPYARSKLSEIVRNLWFALDKVTTITKKKKTYRNESTVIQHSEKKKKNIWIEEGRMATAKLKYVVKIYLWKYRQTLVSRQYVVIAYAVFERNRHFLRMNKKC